MLHIRVIWPAATLGCHPHNILRRVLDVAGLAMHAVLRVDLQALSAIILHEFVHPRRAIARLRPRILREDSLRTGTLAILQLQVARLVFLMVRVAHRYTERQAVETHPPHPAPGNRSSRESFASLQGRVIRMLPHRPRCTASENERIERRNNQPHPHPIMERRANITHAIQFFSHP